jgi:hypothetical protein
MPSEPRSEDPCALVVLLPDFAALAEEVQAIKAAAPGAIHIAGGVHATGEPVQTLDAGSDVPTIGKGESTLLKARRRRRPSARRTRARLP